MNWLIVYALLVLISLFVFGIISLISEGFLIKALQLALLAGLPLVYAIGYNLIKLIAMSKARVVLGRRVTYLKDYEVFGFDMKNNRVKRTSLVFYMKMIVHSETNVLLFKNIFRWNKKDSSLKGGK